MPAQYTLEQFGQRIKAKYPQYASMSDTEVANKVLKKYPQYASSIRGVTPTPGAVLRPLTEKEELETTYPIGAKGETLPENATNFVRDLYTGAYSVLGHPIRTAEGIIKSVIPGTDTPNPIQSLYRGLNTRPAETIATGLGQAAVLEPAGEVARGMVGKSLPKAGGGFRPVETELAGEKVPSLKSEAAPTSKQGRVGAILKRSGVESPKFEKFSKAQTEKVKNVIRKTAQQTSGLMGPMQEEPGAAMKSAAQATFERARPMYAALDEELVTVPGDLHSANVIVKKAITRAKNLGYDFEEANTAHYGEEPLGMGGKLGEGNQPLTTFMKIRSELGKMRASSSDAAFRYRVSEEMKQMTDAMDKALDNTGLKDTWKEADRLWAKGYALNSIADALKKSTEGVEAAVQPKGMEPVPSVLKGKALQETLKDLDDEGVLARGLTTEEASNLRQSANILARAQEVKTGTGEGTVSMWKGIGQAVHGVPAPAIGAVGGYLMGGISGAEKGAAIGLLIQQIGVKPLVSIMTTTKGLDALKAIDAAKTTEQLGKAVNAVTVLGASQQPNRTAAALTPQ